MNVDRIKGALALIVELESDLSRVEALMKKCDNHTVLWVTDGNPAPLNALTPVTGDKNLFLLQGVLSRVRSDITMRLHRLKEVFQRVEEAIEAIEEEEKNNAEES